MSVFLSVNDPQIAQILAGGGIGVLRTDTLYGIVARAEDESAVRRVYEAKGRDDHKSPIVLIDSTERVFDSLSEQQQTYADSVWPGPYSLIIPSTKAPLWVRRGNDSVAYRIPAIEALKMLLESTGPLIAPSANPQGLLPAMDITQAQAYFGDSVDFYVDGGEVTDPTPSQIVRFEHDGTVTRLR